MRTSIKPTVAILSFAGVLVSSFAQATVIDFESLYVNDNGATNGFNNYVESGFQFDSLNNGTLASWHATNTSFIGSTSLFNDQPGNTTQLFKVGGGAFDMTSIDLACVYNDGSVQTVNFVGTRADNSTVNASFNLTNPNTQTTFAFSGMTNIVKLEWNQDAPYHQFDNVTINGAVPEPASLAVLGLGALALIRRRKTSSKN
jgi:hypothetical protein